LGGVTNIHIYSPDAIPGAIYRKAFTDALRPYKVIRLMPLARVNGMGLPPTIQFTTWSKRTTPTQWGQTNADFALEYQAALCRESGCIPWINIPYGSDDDAITRTVQVFASFPVVYVELSNELWNTSPAYQGMQVRNDAVTAGTYGAGDINTVGARRAAQLTARMGALARAAAPNSAVKVVFCGQAVWEAWVVNGLGFVRPGDIDVVAVAPYFQTGSGDPVGTVAQVEASCDKWISTQLLPGLIANQKAAAAYGAVFVAYEGGQSLIPAGGNAPPVELQWVGDISQLQYAAYLADPMRAAQMDPGMGVIYDHMFDACRQANMTLFCNFMVVGNWGRSGCWGLIQTTGEADGPKGLAVKRAIVAGN
jgi:hypothetical protein